MAVDVNPASLWIRSCLISVGILEVTTDLVGEDFPNVVDVRQDLESKFRPNHKSDRLE